MNKQVNILWWLQDKKPIIYNGVKCIPVSIAQITTHDYRIGLVSEHIANGIQFDIITNLKDIIIDHL